MDTKLTLSIDKRVIEKAKRYAKKEGRSISDMVENYLKAVTVEDKSSEEYDYKSKLSPKVRELVGIIKAPKDFDYKKELEEAIVEKYLK